MEMSILPVSPERFASEIVKVVLAEVSAARSLPFHVEGLSGLSPGDLVWDHEGGASPLSKSVVPCHGGEGCRLLISVDNDNHREGKGPYLQGSGGSRTILPLK